MQWKSKQNAADASQSFAFDEPVLAVEDGPPVHAPDANAEGAPDQQEPVEEEMHADGGPDQEVSQQVERHADMPVHPNIEADSLAFSQWQLMERFLAASETRVVSQIQATIDRVVDSMNVLLKQGLGEVEAKYQVALVDLCSDYNPRIHGKNLFLLVAFPITTIWRASR